MFLLIQIISGLIQDKNLLVKLILKITGIYQNQNSELKTHRFIMLIFITTLVTDRLTIFDQKESLLTDIVHSILYPNQISAQKMYRFIPYSLRKDSAFDQIISKFVSIHQHDNDYFFLLRNFDSLNLYSPHINISLIYQYLAGLSEKFPTKLLQVPSVGGDPFGLDLISLLTCSANFQLIYSILFDYHFENSLRSQESIYIVFDQLKIISRFRSFTISNKGFPKITTESVQDLIFNPFEDAFQTPISFKGHPFIPF
jgi:hypothetical protein